MKTTDQPRITKAVSLDADLASWAESRAKAENRSLSNFVETMLLQNKDQDEPQTEEVAR